MELSYKKRKTVVGMMATMVVLGIVGMEQFIAVVSGIEEAEVKADNVSKSFLDMIYKSYGHS